MMRRELMSENNRRQLRVVNILEETEESQEVGRSM
jgi:hypothetical protein